MRVPRIAAALVLISSVSSAAGAQEGLELAKAAQNPISSLARVPLRNNWYFETGIADRTSYALNVDPVVPFTISENYMLVPRLLVPFGHQPIGFNESSSGIGDLQLQTFFTPRTERRDGMQLGFGPAMTFPTASDEVLGGDRWAAGFGAAAVVSPDRWVVGALLTQQWSFAGDSDRRPFAPFTFQPFVNYNFTGWSVEMAPMMTANWLADDDDIVLPLGGGVSKIIGRHVKGTAQAYVNIVRPSFSPEWNAEVALTLLLPRDVRRIARR